MTKKFIDQSQHSAAKISGYSIIIMAIAAVVSTNITIGSLTVPGNAHETYVNIVSSPTSFRIGVYSWLSILICDVLAAWGLFIFFKPVNKNLSMITAWFRLVYVAILAVAMANLLYIVLHLNSLEYLSAIAPDQMQTQVLFHINAFNSIWSFGLIVFGVHIFFLGLLILKSDFVPKIFGYLLLLAFLGYFITNSSNLLFPQYKETMKMLEQIFLIPMLSEVALAIWLLIKAYKTKPAI